MNQERVPMTAGCVNSFIVAVMTQTPICLGFLGIGYLFLWLSWKAVDIGWWLAVLLTIPAVILFASICITGLVIPGPFSAGPGTVNLGYLFRKIIFLSASIPAVLWTFQQIEFLFP